MAVEAVSSKRHRKKLRRAHHWRAAHPLLRVRVAPCPHVAASSIYVCNACGVDRAALVRRMLDWGIAPGALGLPERIAAAGPATLFILDELSDIPSSVFQPSLLQRPEPE